MNVCLVPEIGPGQGLKGQGSPDQEFWPGRVSVSDRVLKLTFIVLNSTFRQINIGFCHLVFGV